MLNVNFAGLELKNPFLIGSGSYGWSIEQLPRNAKRIAEAGWAGVIPKSYKHKDHPYQSVPNPCLFPLSGTIRNMGMENVGPYVPPSTEEKIKKAVKAAKEVDLKIFMSIIGRTLEEWVEFARKMEECGADAVEVNLSAPMTLMTTKATMSPVKMSENIDVCEKVIGAIRQECGIPIIVKLSPHSYDLSPLAKCVEKAGANAISAVNTILGLSGIDIETGIPLCSDTTNKAILSGISGPLIKPIGLRCVTQIAKAVEIPVSGVGGITDHKSAIEYMMVGAKTVQLCTAVMWHGFGIANDLIKGLKEFMHEKGYRNIEEFVGMSLRYIVEEQTQMSLKPALAIIDETSCTGCKRCVKACADAAYDAITLRGEIPVVNKNVCVGCGLCKVVCPVPSCISIVSRNRIDR